MSRFGSKHATELLSPPSVAGRQSSQLKVESVPEHPLAANERLPKSTDPTKVTVRLTPKSVDALERAAEIGGLNRTDTINRAIQLYSYIVEMLAERDDNALLVVRNGVQERVILR